MITYVYYIILYLVGGVNHLEKYESQWERLSHILWKIKTTMFETTNQHSIHVVFRSHLFRNGQLDPQRGPATVVPPPISPEQRTAATVSPILFRGTCRNFLKPEKHVLMVQICLVSMWGFPKMEVPPNGWFIRESTKYH